MQTYVAQISGRSIFAFRSPDQSCAQAWLDIHVAMRRRLETALSNGERIWDGQSDIVARKATSAEGATWQDSIDQVAGTNDVEEQDNITVWLILPPPDAFVPQNKKAASKRRPS